MSIVFKICEASAWRQAERRGRFAGSAADLRDGFIHLSSAAQVAATAEKHFAAAADLVLVAVDAAALGAALRWEPSRGGELFPHLYGELPIACMRWTRPLARLSDGSLSFPGLDA
ncbi:MAG: DUF952 domain-containing protein [Proteobacteria bacterium]|nr:DUF952 domain-containing protein [Pseudomonadota bacterium]